MTPRNKGRDEFFVTTGVFRFFDLRTKKSFVTLENVDPSYGEILERGLIGVPG